MNSRGWLAARIPDLTYFVCFYNVILLQVLCRILAFWEKNDYNGRKGRDADMEKDWLKEHYQEETGILDLSFSGLTSLPDSIRELKGLKILDLSGLNLKELPDWLPDLGLPFSREPDGDGVRLYETTVEGIDMVIFDQPYEVVFCRSMM